MTARSYGVCCEYGLVFFAFGPGKRRLLTQFSICPGLNQDCSRSSGRSQASLPVDRATVAVKVADFASIL